MVRSHVSRSGVARPPRSARLTTNGPFFPVHGEERIEMRSIEAASRIAVHGEERIEMRSIEAASRTTQVQQ